MAYRTKAMVDCGAMLAEEGEAGGLHSDFPMGFLVLHPPCLD